MQRKEEAGLICCRVLPAQGGVTIVVHSNVEARPMQRFFSREAEIRHLACQNRTFSKIKLLLRLAAFIDTLLA